jgi:UrcA family protein
MEGGFSFRGGEMTMGIHSVGRLVRRSVFGGVAALLCLNASLSSAADADDVVRREIVGFGDLNLSDPEGVAVLYRRIKAAAHRVCSDRNNRTLLIWSKAETECKRAAIARAVASVNNVHLAVLHREMSGSRHGQRV